MNSLSFSLKNKSQISILLIEYATTTRIIGQNTTYVVIRHPSPGTKLSPLKFGEGMGVSTPPVSVWVITILPVSYCDS